VAARAIGAPEEGGEDPLRLYLQPRVEVCPTAVKRLIIVLSTGKPPSGGPAFHGPSPLLSSGILNGAAALHGPKVAEDLVSGEGLRGVRGREYAERRLPVFRLGPD
jgi:hypothetical protein